MATLLIELSRVGLFSYLNARHVIGNRWGETALERRLSGLPSRGRVTQRLADRELLH